MEDQDFALHIKKANSKLKSLCSGIQIEKRGMRLNLRGVLPPRPGSRLTKKSQQRIPLNLPANKEGVEKAEQEAMLVSQSVKDKSFSWNKYNPKVKAIEEGFVTLTNRYKDFESHVLTKTVRGGKTMSPSTWEQAYRPYLTRLERTLEGNPSMSLVEGIYETVKVFDESSRSRAICCQTLSSLADFLSLEMPYPLHLMKGEYKNPTARKLPNDEEILRWWEQIPNEQWQFVYGMIATYGLRNYEPFFSERPDTSGVVYTEDPSTMHSREVWPFLPSWVKAFDLNQGMLPPVSTDMDTTTLQLIGQRVTRQFKRYGIPFSPAALRWAWAARLIREELPESILAKMLGSSRFNIRKFINSNAEDTHVM
jgi:hypothetical protein